MMQKILFLFGELNDDDIDWIIASGMIENIAAETILIQEGNPSDYLYILLEGEVIVSVNVLENAKEIATLGTGEVFGEMSFIDGRPPLCNSGNQQRFSGSLPTAIAVSVPTIP